MTCRAVFFNKEIYRRPFEDRASYNIKLFLPPTDIPDYIKTCYDSKSDRLNILFVYPSVEKENELFDQANMRLFVACSSGKPLRLEIKNLKKNRIDKVKLTNIIKNDVGRLVKQISEASMNLRQKANLNHIDEVLNETADYLVECVPSA